MPKEYVPAVIKGVGVGVKTCLFLTGVFSSWKFLMKT